VTNFDRVARSYRWLEYFSFGPCLARCRCAQLVHLTQARHALILGDGDGRFLARLLTVNPNLTADVVDSSPAMLRLLEQRTRRSNQRVRLHAADALQWSPTDTPTDTDIDIDIEPYDLIVSHFFLDCFFPEELEQLFDRILPHALPGTQWVISEFAIPRTPLAAFLARAVIGLLYRAFALLTGLRVRKLPDYATALRRRGLLLIHDHRYLAGLLCSQLWTLPTFPSRK
jgi:SAM-dependent methyltransferase